MVGGQMLHQDERHPRLGVGRHRGEERFEGRQAAGRSANPDDRHGGLAWGRRLFLSGRVLRVCGLRRASVPCCLPGGRPFPNAGALRPRFHGRRPACAT